MTPSPDSSPTTVLPLFVLALLLGTPFPFHLTKIPNCPFSLSIIIQCIFCRLRNCAFLDFNNEALAYQAQRQLNGYFFFFLFFLFYKKNLVMRELLSLSGVNAPRLLGNWLWWVESVAHRSLIAVRIVVQNAATCNFLREVLLCYQ
jgi:hypothetical protein